MIVLPVRPSPPPSASPPAEATPNGVSGPPEASCHRHRRIAVPAALGAAVVLAIFGMWMLIAGFRPSPAAAPPPAATMSGPVVAVLPFENNTGDSA